MMWKSYQKQRKKVLASLAGYAVGHNAMLTVEDYSQEMSVEILVQQRKFEEEGAEEATEFFQVHGEVKGPKEEEKEEDEDSDSDDLCEVVMAEEGAPVPAQASSLDQSKKRKASVVPEENLKMPISTDTGCCCGDEEED